MPNNIRQEIIRELGSQGITTNKFAEVLKKYNIPRSVVYKYLNYNKDCYVSNVEKMMDELGLNVTKK